MIPISVNIPPLLSVSMLVPFYAIIETVVRGCCERRHGAAPPRRSPAAPGSRRKEPSIDIVDGMRYNAEKPVPDPKGP